MTCWPIPENHHVWWLTTTTWRRLHAVPGDDLVWDDLELAIEDGEYVLRTAVCGWPLGLTYPGVVSRFSLPRCAWCSRKLGVPRGSGSPVNEKANKAAEARRKEGDQ